MPGRVRGTQFYFLMETFDDAGVLIGAVRLGVDGALLLDSSFRNR
ncbi:MAG TPA: hypothetical protein VNK23_17790 [Candidatus Dormibacteraeota bacterium]|nr:hypothetical protein [Candidatus Dormibacteraeota bacterium]